MVITTTPTRRLAGQISSALVGRRLAACVQVAGPVNSTYRWQGKLENGREYMLFIKTTRPRYPAVEKAIRELHPYSTPEIIALAITSGAQDYLSWLKTETVDKSPPDQK
jgi:periplasmic divalent cation tolerance protein